MEMSGRDGIEERLTAVMEFLARSNTDPVGAITASPDTRLRKMRRHGHNERISAGHRGCGTTSP